MRRFHSITIPPESIASPPETPGDNRAYYTTRLKAEEITGDTTQQPIMTVFEAEGNRGYQPFQLRPDLVESLAHQCNVAPEHLRYMEYDKEGELKGGTAFREYVFRREPNSGELHQVEAAIPYTREQYEEIARSYDAHLFQPNWAEKREMPSHESMKETIKEANISGSDKPDSQPHQNSDPNNDHDFEPEM